MIGQFDPSYTRLTGVRTDEDIRRYFQQPEKQAVADALNSGIIQQRFGQSARYVEGRVIHTSQQALIKERKSSDFGIFKASDTSLLTNDKPWTRHRISILPGIISDKRQ